jgi:hypothetical protein
MNYQQLIIAGNATRDAERKTAKDGKTHYADFSVGVANRKGKPTYFPVRVFGKQVDPIVTYVKKGREVLVSGRIDIGEKGWLCVIADRVVFGGKPSARGKTKPPEEQEAARDGMPAGEIEAD